MAFQYHVLVEGNSLSFKNGFFGFSSIVLIQGEALESPILFDTGHHSTRLLLLDALKQFNLDPADIRHVFLSHLHFDHANNIDLFSRATFYLSQTELDYARAPAKTDIFCSDLINQYLKNQKLYLLNDEEGEIAPGIFYRAAPGHTIGSYLLHFLDENNQRVVLAGDACKTYKELASLSAAHEFDPQKRSSTTLEWIAKHADIVIPGHFPPLYKTPNGWIWKENTHFELIIR